MALSRRASMLLMQRMRMLQSVTAVLVRPLSLTSARLVDKPLFDEYTRRKSEFRISGMDDKRCRERSSLDIPFYVLSASLAMILIIWPYIWPF